MKAKLDEMKFAVAGAFGLTRTIAGRYDWYPTRP